MSWNPGIRPFAPSVTRNPASAGAPTAPLAGAQARLERLTSVVVPARQREVAVANFALVLSRVALRNAETAYRDTARGVLTTAQRDAVARVNGAQNPQQEIAARAHLANVENALRALSRGAPLPQVQAAMELVRGELVRGVNHAQTPQGELAARAALAAFEVPLRAPARVLRERQEGVTQRVAELGTARERLQTAQTNANALADRLGVPQPYPPRAPVPLPYVPRPY